jgi:hypothetical protein
MKLNSIIISAILLGACNHSSSLEGSYKGSNGNLLDKITWYLDGKKFVRLGTRLKLKHDKTFEYQTCGCESNGTWALKNDTLYLEAKESTFTSRSMEAKYEHCNTSNYRLLNNKLYRIKYDNSKYLECLEHVVKE